MAIYTALSKSIFLKSLGSESITTHFFGPYIFGVIAGIFFLYLFNHEDFFHFIKEVEEIEKKKENKFLKKYLHLGRILATLIIASLGGPVFAALTARFLINKFWFKYLILALGNIPSTILSVTLAKGAWNLVT